MKTKIQKQREAQRRLNICMRAHADGLDVTDCSTKTLNVLAKVYGAIDRREERDERLLEEYEDNAVSTCSIAEETGVAKTTLMKEPFVSVIDAHRRKPKGRTKSPVEVALSEENRSLKEWKACHAETEIELVRLKEELAATKRELYVKQKQLKRKRELLDYANRRLTEAGAEPVNANDEGEGFILTVTTGQNTATNVS